MRTTGGGDDDDDPAPLLDLKLRGVGVDRPHCGVLDLPPRGVVSPVPLGVQRPLGDIVNPTPLGVVGLTLELTGVISPPPKAVRAPGRDVDDDKGNGAMPGIKLMPLITLLMFVLEMPVGVSARCGSRWRWVRRSDAWGNRISGRFAISAFVRPRGRRTLLPSLAAYRRTDEQINMRQRRRQRRRNAQTPNGDSLSNTRT